MTSFHARIRVAADGSLTGQADPCLPPGEHEVTVTVDERASPPADREERAARLARLEAIARHCAGLPELDPRPADEILDYDESGAFKPW